MSYIAQTSVALIEHIKELTQGALIEVDEHPGQWDDSSIRRIIRNPPAVYVAWLGQSASYRPNEVLANWAIFIVAEVLNGQRTDSVGIYQIVETLTAGIDGRHVEPSGLFKLESVQNLWSDTQSEMGVAVYAMYFTAQQAWTPEVPDLTNFKVYHNTTPNIEMN